MLDKVAKQKREPLGEGFPVVDGIEKILGVLFDTCFFILGLGSKFLLLYLNHKRDS